MNGFYCDWDIKSLGGNITYIDHELVYSFCYKDNTVGKTKDKPTEYSFLPIKNCFNNLDLWWCTIEIVGATPVEILRSILLELCGCISEGMELAFTDSAMNLICHVFVGIYQDSRRQSEHDVPGLSLSRHGWMYAK